MTPCGQLQETDAGHPSSAFEMSFVETTNCFRVLVRVNAKDMRHSLTPVGTLVIGIEQSQIIVQMTLIVFRQFLRCRRLAQAFRIKCGHQRSLMGNIAYPPRG